MSASHRRQLAATSKSRKHPSCRIDEQGKPSYLHEILLSAPVHEQRLYVARVAYHALVIDNRTPTTDDDARSPALPRLLDTYSPSVHEHQTPITPSRHSSAQTLEVGEDTVLFELLCHTITSAFILGRGTNIHHTIRGIKRCMDRWLCYVTLSLNVRTPPSCSIRSSFSWTKTLKSVCKSISQESSNQRGPCRRHHVHISH